MAEICCGIVNEQSTTTQTTCEQISGGGRRKRMDLGSFKFVCDMAESSERRKRQKIMSTDIEEAAEECKEKNDESVLEEYSSPVENCKDDNDDEDEDEDSHSSNSGSVESCLETASTNSSSSPPPPTVKLESLISDRCPKYGFSSVCGRRRDMEDAVSIHPSFSQDNSQIPARCHFFGVYDGHGCSHVAMSCRDRLHQLVKEEIEISSESSSSLEWKEKMEKSFSRMDKEASGSRRNGSELIKNCRCELQTPKCDAVGSTAVVSVITPTQIVVANCGDSRAVLCRGGKSVPLSVDHKPDRPDELLRVEEAGGRVIYWDGPRVLGVLAMSRAIGDNYLKPYVISEPEITITDRTDEDECMILASDGLWDVVSNEFACNIVRMCLMNGQGPSKPLTSSCAGEVNKSLTDDESSDKACSEAALLLTKLALARHSSDNVSVVVVDLRKNT